MKIGSQKKKMNFMTKNLIVFTLIILLLAFLSTSSVSDFIYVQQNGVIITNNPTPLIWIEFTAEYVTPISPIIYHPGDRAHPVVNSFDASTLDNYRTWYFNFTRVLPDGDYIFELPNASRFENYMDTPFILPFRVDREAPAAPAIVYPKSNSVTSDNLITVLGQTEPGANVILRASNVPVIEPIYFDTTVVAEGLHQPYLPSVFSLVSIEPENVIVVNGDLSQHEGRYIEFNNHPVPHYMISLASYNDYLAQTTVNLNPNQALDSDIRPGDSFRIYNFGKASGQFEVPVDLQGTISYITARVIDLVELISPWRMPAINITVDNSYPTLNYSYPTGILSSKNITIFATVVDDVKVSNSSTVMIINNVPYPCGRGVINSNCVYSGDKVLSISKNLLFEDGPVEVIINAADNAGNQRAYSWTFHVDSRVPQTPLIVVNDSVNNPTMPDYWYVESEMPNIYVEFNMSENLEIEGTWLQKDGIQDLFFNCNNAADQGFIPPYDCAPLEALLDGGKYRFTVAAKKDLDGIFSSTNNYSIWFIVDKLPPYINISGSAFVGSLVVRNVRVDWSDSTISNISVVSGDRTIMLSLDQNAVSGIEYLDVPVSPGEGTKTITAAAYDKFGHISTATMQVIVDTIPPSVTIDSLTNSNIAFYENQWMTGIRTVTVQGSYADTNILKVYENGTSNLAALNTDLNRYSINVNLDEGLNYITIVAEDINGLKGQTTVEILFNPDPPEITINSPIEVGGEYFTNDMLPLFDINTSQDASCFVAIDGLLQEAMSSSVDLLNHQFQMREGSLLHGTHQASFACENYPLHNIRILNKNFNVDLMRPILHLASTSGVRQNGTQITQYNIYLRGPGINLPKTTLSVADSSSDHNKLRCSFVCSGDKCGVSVIQGENRNGTSGLFGSEEYKSLQQMTVIYFPEDNPNGDYTYDVTCIDQAGNEQTSQILIQVDVTIQLAIVQTSPINYKNSRNIDLFARTNLPANCNFNHEVQQNVEMHTTNFIDHSMDLDLDEGNYDILITCIRADQMFTDIEHAIFGIDLTPPEILALDSPSHPDEDIGSNQKTIVLSWDAIDELSGVSNYSYMLTQSPQGTPNYRDGKGSATNVTYPDMDDGTYYFHLIAGDNAGNWNNLPEQIRHRNITIDSTGPSRVTLSLPSSATREPTISINGTAYRVGNTVEEWAYVDVYVNNNNVGRVQTNARGVFYYNITLSNGLNTVYVSAYDNLINGPANSSTIPINYINQAPALDALLPVSEAVICNLTYALATITQRDSVGIDRELSDMLLFDSLNNIIPVDVTKVFANGVQNLNLRLVPQNNLFDGTYTLRVDAYDVLGNYYQYSSSFIINSGSACIYITNPMQTPFLTTESSVIIQGYIVSTTAATAVITVKNNTRYTNYTVNLVSGEGRFTFQMPLQLVQGETAFDVIVENGVASSSTGFYRLIRDNVNPTISITAPNSDIITNKTMTSDLDGISGNYYDAYSQILPPFSEISTIDSIIFKSNGIDVGSLRNLIGNKYIINLDLAEGVNAFSAIAYDLLYNSGQASVTITRDTTLPKVNITGFVVGANQRLINLNLENNITEFATNAKVIRAIGSYEELNVDKIYLKGNVSLRASLNNAQSNYHTDIPLKEGDNILAMTIDDLVGNSGESNTVSVFLDSTPPAITVNKPQRVGGSYFTNDRNPEFEVTTSEPADCRIKMFGYHDMLPSADFLTHYYRYTDSQLGENNFDVEITCSDKIVENANTTTFEFTIDFTSPQINLSANPGVMDATSGLDYLQYNLYYNDQTLGVPKSVLSAFDQSVDHDPLNCTYVCSGDNCANSKTVSDDSWPRGTDGVFGSPDFKAQQQMTVGYFPPVGSNGDYVYDVMCVDRANNADEAQMTIHVDATQELTVIESSPSGFINDLGVTLYVKTNLQSDCYYQSNVWGMMGSANKIDHSQNVMFNEGPHFVQVRCERIDLAYNITTTLAFTIDTTSPVTSSLNSSSHPSEDEYYPRDDAQFTWTTDDSISGVVNFSWVLDTRNNTIPNPARDAAGRVNSMQFFNLSDDIHYFHLIAKDGAGNWQTQNEAKHRKIMIDTTGPNRVVLNQLPQATKDSTYLLSGTVFKRQSEREPFASVEIFLNNGAVIVSESNEEGAFSREITLQEGVNLIVATSYDSLGNGPSDNSTASIFYLNQAPRLEYVSPANGSIMCKIEQITGVISRRGFVSIDHVRTTMNVFDSEGNPVLGNASVVFIDTMSKANVTFVPEEEFDDGTYSIELVSADVLGNIISYNSTFEINSEAACVYITSPMETPYFTRETQNLIEGYIVSPGSLVATLHVKRRSLDQIFDIGLVFDEPNNMYVFSYDMGLSEGDTAFEVSVQNDMAYSKTGYYHMIKDITNPFVDIQTPQPQGEIITDVDSTSDFGGIAGEYVDDYADALTGEPVDSISHINFYRAGALVSTLDALSGGTYLRYLSLDEGLNDFRIMAFDKVNNNFSATVNIIKDTHSPAIGIDRASITGNYKLVYLNAPGDITDIATNSPAIRLSGDYEEANMLSVYKENNESIRGTFDRINSNYSIAVPLVLGDNVIAVVAEDKLHRISASQQIHVLYDPNPPVINIIKPTKEGSLYWTNEVNPEFQIETSKPANCYLTINDVVTDMMDSAVDNLTHSYIYDMSELGDAVFGINITCNDLIIESSSTSLFTLSVDLHNPVLKLESRPGELEPGSNSSIIQYNIYYRDPAFRTPRANISAEDLSLDRDLVKCSYVCSGEKCVSSIVQGQNGTQGILGEDNFKPKQMMTVTYLPSADPNGDYLYDITCVDRAGNIDAKRVLIHVDVNISLSIINSSPSGNLNSGIVDFRAKTNLESNCLYYEGLVGIPLETTDHINHNKHLTLVEGHYNYPIVCEKIDQGFFAYGDISFTVDLNPPIVSNLASPTHPNNETDYSTKDAVFTWNATDSMSGVANFYWVLNDIRITIPTEDNLKGPSERTEINNLTDGTYYFHLRAVDYAGNWQPSWQVLHRRIGIDTTRPAKVEFDNLPEAINNAVLSVTGIVIKKGTTPEPYARINIYVNSLEPVEAFADESGRFGAFVNLDEGLNVITANAYDQLGNGPSANSTIETVHLVNLAPTLEYITPQDGAIICKVPQITGLISKRDPVAINTSGSTIRVIGPDMQPLSGNVIVGIYNGGQYVNLTFVPTASFINGTYLVELVASDVIGNSITYSSEFEINSSAACVYLTSPEQIITFTTQTTYLVEGYIVSSSNSNAVLTLDNGNSPNNYDLSLVYNDGLGRYLFSKEINLTNDGEYLVEVSVQNQMAFSRTGDYHLIRDRTNPTINIDVPANGILTDLDYTSDIGGIVGNYHDLYHAVRGGTVDSLKQIEVYKGAEQLTSITNFANDIYSVDLPLGEGLNDFKLVAQDIVGHTSFDLVNITRDTTAPAIVATGVSVQGNYRFVYLEGEGNINSVATNSPVVRISGMVDELNIDSNGVYLESNPSVHGVVDRNVGTFYINAPLVLGDNYFVVVAEDKLGHTDLSQEIHVLYDSVAPNITINYPTREGNYYYTNQQHPTFEVLTSEEGSCDITVMSFNPSPMSSTADGLNHTYTYVTTPLNDGTFSASVTCSDRIIGNTNTLSFQFRVDKTSPVVRLASSSGVMVFDQNSGALQYNIYYRNASMNTPMTVLSAVDSIQGSPSIKCSFVCTGEKCLNSHIPDIDSDHGIFGSNIFKPKQEMTVVYLPDWDPNGDYTYDVTCIDIAGNSGEARIIILVDVDIQLYVAESLPAGYVKTSNVELYARTNLEATCKFYNQSTLVSMDTTNNFVHTKDIRLNEGIQNFRVVCDRIDGSFSAESNISFTVDLTPPRINSLNSSSHPLENVYYSNNDVLFNWIASDLLSGIANFSWRLNQNPALPANTTPNGYVGAVEYIDQPDGTYYFHLKAVDLAGNWMTNENNSIRTINIDTTGPHHVVLDTPPGATNSQALKVTGKVYSTQILPEPNAFVDIYVNNEEPITVVANSTGDFEADITLVEGLNTFSASAFDYLNNGPSLQNSTIKSIYYVNQAPRLEYFNPQDSSIICEIPFVSGIISRQEPVAIDNLETTIQVIGPDGEHVVGESTVNLYNSGRFANATFVPDALFEPGIYTIQLIAVDVIGNQETYSSTFEINPSAACIYLTSPADQIYFTKVNPIQISGYIESPSDSRAWLLLKTRSREESLNLSLVYNDDTNRYEFSKEISLFNDGETLFEVSAQNGIAYSKTGYHHLIRDTTPPTIEITSPIVPSNGILTDKDLTSYLNGIMGEYHDSYPAVLGGTVDTIKQIDFYNSNISVGSSSDITGDQFIKDLQINEGRNEYELVAYDVLDNYASAYLTITRDTTNPTISVSGVSISGNYKLVYLNDETDFTALATNSNSIRIYGTFVDENPDSVYIAGNEVVRGTINKEAGNFSIVVPLVQGDNSFAIEIEDKLGLVVQSQQFNVLYDSIAPEIEITNPIKQGANYYTNAGHPEFDVVTSESSRCSITIDVPGVEPLGPYPMESTDSLNHVFILNNIYLNDGRDYGATIVCKDMIIENSQIKEINFIVDHINPTIELSSSVGTQDWNLTNGTLVYNIYYRNQMLRTPVTNLSARDIARNSINDPLKCSYTCTGDKCSESLVNGSSGTGGVFGSNTFMARQQMAVIYLSQDQDPNGDYIYDVTCTDRSSNINQTRMIIHVEVDIQLHIEETLPSGYLNHQNIELYAKTNLAGVCSFFNGTSNVLMDSENYVDHTKDLRLPEGAHNLQIVCDRIDGDFSDSETARFTIDLTPPTILELSSFSHPDQSQSYSNKNVQFSWTAIDALSGISGFSWVFDDKEITVPDNDPEGDARGAEFNVISDKTYYFHLKAQDIAGNWQLPNQVSHFKVTVDTTGPERVVLDNIVESTNLQNLRVEGTVYKLHNNVESSAMVMVYVNDEPKGIGFSDDLGRFYADVILSDYRNIITAAAFDSLLNGPSANSSSKSIYYINQAPGLESVQPNDGAIICEAEQVTAMLSRKDGVEIDLSGSIIELFDSDNHQVSGEAYKIFAAGGQLLNLTFVPSSGDFDDGAYTIKVEAKDSLGNAAQYETVFSVNSEAACIYLTNPAQSPYLTKEATMSIEGFIRSASYPEVLLSLSTIGMTNITALQLSPDGDRYTFSKEVSLVEGETVFDVSVNNNLAYSTTGEYHVIKDLANPKIAVTAPANNLLTDKATTGEVEGIAGTYLDYYLDVDGARNDFIDRIEFYSGSGFLGALIGLYGNLYFNDLQLEEGLNEFNITAFDKVDNFATAMHNITSDRTPPTIYINSASVVAGYNLVYLNGPGDISSLATDSVSVRLSGTFVEENMKTVYLLNNPNVAGVFNNAQGSFYINAPLVLGQNTITVVAQDLVGHISEQQVINVLFDPNAPSITINKPIRIGGEYFTNQAKPEFEVTTSEDADCNVWVTGLGPFYMEPTIDGLNHYHRYNVSFLGHGVVNAQVICSDKIIHSENHTDFLVFVDMHNPVLNLSASNTSRVQGVDQEVLVYNLLYRDSSLGMPKTILSAKDDSADHGPVICNFTCFEENNKCNSTIIQGSGLKGTGGVFGDEIFKTSQQIAVVYSHPTDPNGDYIYDVSCIDRAGNIGQKQMIIHVEVNRELSMEVTRPQGFVSEGTVELYVKTNLAAECKYINSNNDLILLDSNNYVEHKKTVSFNEGTHSISVVCTRIDYAYTAFGSINFTIDTIEPEIVSVNSSTHPEESLFYSNRNAELQWVAQDSGSGISGYSYVFDKYQNTIPDMVIEGDSPGVGLNASTDGIYYFHLRAKDNAGNWMSPESTEHREVRIDTKPPYQVVLDNIVGTTRDQTIGISGAVFESTGVRERNAHVSLFLNDIIVSEIDSNGQGEFSTGITLMPGLNIIKARAYDEIWNGPSANSSAKQVYYIDEAPVLESINPDNAVICDIEQATAVIKKNDNAEIDSSSQILIKDSNNIPVAGDPSFQYSANHEKAILTFTPMVSFPTGLPNGFYNIEVIAKDEIGNIANYNSHFEVNDEAACIHITTPSELVSFTSETQATIRGYIISPSVSAVTLAMNNHEPIVVELVEEAGRYAFSVDVALAEEENIFEVFADNDFVQSRTGEYNIIKDTKAPALSILEPQNGASTFYDSTAGLSGIYGEYSDYYMGSSGQVDTIREIEFYKSETRVGILENPYGNYYFMDLGLIEGLNQFKVIAYDIVGNSRSRYVNITMDTQAPIVQVTNAVVGNTKTLVYLDGEGIFTRLATNSNILRFTGVFDDANIAKIYLLSNPSNNAALNMQDKTFSINIPLQEGANEIIIEARDELGFTTTTTPMNVIYDPNPPFVQLLEPNTTRTNTSMPLISVSTDKPSSCKASYVPYGGQGLYERLFDTEDGLYHSFIVDSGSQLNFVFGGNVETQIAIECTDELLHIKGTLDQIITVDKRAPTINSFSSTNGVLGGESANFKSYIIVINNITQFVVSSSEFVKCRYGQIPSYEQMNDFNNDDYAINHISPYVELLQFVNYSFYLQCKDMADHLSSFKIINLSVDNFAQVRITDTSPVDYTGDENPVVSVITNMRAVCSISEAAGQASFRIYNQSRYVKTNIMQMTASSGRFMHKIFIDSNLNDSSQTTLLPLNDGTQYYINVNCWDPYTNLLGSSTSFAFTADYSTIDPIILTPSEGEVFTATMVQVTGIAEAGSLVKVYVQSQMQDMMRLQSEMQSLTGDFSMTALLDEGNNTILVRSIDSVGNEGTASVEVIFNSIGPKGIITINPPGGSLREINNITASFVQQSGTPLDIENSIIRLEKLVEDPHVEVPGTVSVLSQNSFAFVPTSQPFNITGTYKVMVIPRDADGNEGPGKVATYIIDPNAPEIIVYEPSNILTNNSNVYFSGRITPRPDYAKLNIFHQGQLVTRILVVSNLSVFNQTFILEEGLNYYVIEAAKGGNTGQTPERVIDIDTTGPGIREIRVR